jgi:hypothetical protein
MNPALGLAACERIAGPFSVEKTDDLLRHAHFPTALSSTAITSNIFPRPSTSAISMPAARAVPSSETGYRSFLGIHSGPASGLTPDVFCKTVIERHVASTLKGHLLAITWDVAAAGGMTRGLGRIAERGYFLGMRRVASPRRPSVSRITSALPAAKPSPFPAFIEPAFLATLRDKVPAAAGFVHELKLDGYRVQAHRREGSVTLYTRSGLDWTTQFPTIAGEPGRARLATRPSLTGSAAEEKTMGIVVVAALAANVTAVPRSRHYISPIFSSFTAYMAAPSRG